MALVLVERGGVESGTWRNRGGGSGAIRMEGRAEASGPRWRLVYSMLDMWP